MAAARKLLPLLLFGSAFAAVTTSPTITTAPTTTYPTAIPTTALPTALPTASPSAAPTTIAPSTTTPTSAPTSLPTPATAAPTTELQLCERNLTMADLAVIIANNASSCPVIITDRSGKKMVYEMASFARFHAHGKNDIYQFCGHDMTQAFEGGAHRFVPFLGTQGTLGSLNRSTIFTCVGTFLPSSAQPTPSQAPSPTVKAVPYPCLTPGKEYQIKQVIVDAFHKIPTTLDNRERAAFNGGLVRLAFHDAATYSMVSKDGGPDGCVNLNDPDNAGLQKHVDAMELLWTPFKDRISRADFWYLAAITVIETAGGPKIKFRYGRKDCTPETFAKNNDIGRLPAPDRDWFYVRGFFGYALGMTDREITALFGAHVLGRAHPANSGFDGPWVSGPSPGMKFSNQFYLGLQTVEWVKETNNFTGFPGRHQWNQGGVGTGLQMFLSSDIALLVTNPDDPACTNSLVDTTRASVNDAVPKDPDCLKNNVTLAIVDEYSRSQVNFYRDFAAAFQKLCELGYSEGSLLPTGTCFPGAATFPNDPAPPSEVSGEKSSHRVGPLLVVGLTLAAFF